MTGQPDAAGRDVATADVASTLRRILAELTGDPAPLSAPLDTPLLRDGIGLDSLGGAVLLARVRSQFGVDVASEDLNLDAMATIRSLSAFIVERLAAGGTPLVPGDGGHVHGQVR